MGKTAPLFSEALPEHAHRLRGLLIEHGLRDLADSVSDLRIYGMCGCGAADCAAFDTAPEPREHRAETVVLGRDSIDIIVNVQDDAIVSLEFPLDEHAHTALVNALSA